MNPVILYLASGEGLYPAAGLLLLAVMLSARSQPGWRMRLRNLFAWVGLGMIVMAAPPVPWWVAIPGFAAFLAWYAASDKKPPLSRVRFVTMAISAALLLVLISAVTVNELLWRAAPAITTPTPATRLTVIGDSISAGIYRDEPWPAIFQKRTGIEVRNLARAGDQVVDALDQAKKLTSDDRLLLIEIGGNDLIGGTPSADFHAHLDRLLAACAGPGRTVIMYELPLLPHRTAYGRSQRQLAAKHGVILIPKRFLIDTLKGAGATSDGLHLSPAGAQHMAWQVEFLLRDVLPQGGKVTAVE